MLVLWLKDEAFNQAPLSRLTGLLKEILPAKQKAFKVRVLGPLSSDGVLALLREVKAGADQPPFDIKSALCINKRWNSEYSVRDSTR